ncbi:MAG: zinc ABC transporter substrate-binding protein [Pseudomonadota bacterium]
MKKFNLHVIFGLTLFIQSLLVQAKTQVFVSILPQQFFVQYLADDFLEVKVLVKPWQSPETFDPSPRQMAMLSESKLYFTLGLGFEQRIIKRIIANNKQLQVIATETGITKIANDPHIWLDPQLVQLQVKNIYMALLMYYPNFKEKLQHRYQQLQNQIKLLDNSLLSLFEQAKSNNAKFVIFHPALNYFSRRYQLNQIAIEKNGKHSSAKYLAKLMSHLKSQSVKYILVEKQFSKKEAQTIARVLNAQLLEFDPLAYSWFNNMQRISKQVQLALF